MLYVDAELARKPIDKTIARGLTLKSEKCVEVVASYCPDATAGNIDPDPGYFHRCGAGNGMGFATAGHCRSTSTYRPKVFSHRRDLSLFHLHSIPS